MSYSYEQWLNKIKQRERERYILIMDDTFPLFSDGYNNDTWI